jgi:hypothetical protein
MGIETILFAAFTGLSAVSKMSANKQAKDVTRNAQAQSASDKAEGELASKEKAKQIRYAAARQTSSFLSSGITLDGTPQDVLNETFTTGLEDIDNIERGYNTRINNTISQANSTSKNIIASARSEVIGDIVGSFGGMSFGESFNVPFTGSSTTFSPGGIPIPGNKPLRISV